MARSVVLHTGGSLVLAVGLCALLMLADAAGMLPRQFAAPAARSARFGAQPNPPQPSATLSLVSPSSGQGPVGATLTVSGNTWNASQVAIGAASSSANCANPTAGSATGWVATFNTTSVSNGSFTFSFTWPASLSAGNPYSLCAVAAPGGQPASSGGVAASPTTSNPGTYTVRSSQPPTLSLSSSTVQVGQPYTITGTSFYGVPSVNIFINNVLNQSVRPDGNGSFIVSVTPTADQAGNANIVAQSPPEGNAKPVLTATAQITVQGAPTVTPDPSPSPSPSPTIDATGTAAANSGGSPGGTTSTTGGGGGGGLIIVLIIAILLLLALIGGAITFLVLRRRGGGGPAFPGGPAGPGGPGSGGDWGGYPGHGTGPVPQYGQSATGHYGAAGSYGPTGFYPQPDPYAGQQAGGVASWDDAPPMGGVGWDDPGGSAPGPDWQPRPMSGSQRRYDDPSYPPYAAPGQAPADPYGGAPTSSGYAPPDPWASTGSSYSGPPRGYAPPGRGATGYPPRPAPPQPPDAPWNSGENQDDNWNPGGTNPTNQGW